MYWCNRSKCESIYALVLCTRVFCIALLVFYFYYINFFHFILHLMANMHFLHTPALTKLFLKC